MKTDVERVMAALRAVPPKRDNDLQVAYPDIEGMARAALAAIPSADELRDEWQPPREALERALRAFDNVLGQLEAHQENTGEQLESEDQAVVRAAKQDADFARDCLSALASKGGE